MDYNNQYADYTALQKEITDLDNVMLEMKEKRINIDENKRVEAELEASKVELDQFTYK